MPWIAWPLLTLGALVAFLGSVFGVGARLPRDHVVTRRLRLNQPVEAVWARLTDHAGASSWRRGIKRVERLADHDGHEVWREVSGDAIDLETTLVEGQRRLIRRITGDRRDFGGEWEYELASDGASTLVTVTERGEVYHPLYRFVSRFILGHTRTLDTYLRDLASSFGEAATIEDGTPSDARR